MSPLLDEAPDAWELPLAGSTVTRITVDYAFGLLLADEAGGSFECQIESPFTLLGPDGGSERFVPGENPVALGAALVVLRGQVVNAMAQKRGELTITLAGNLVLSAPASHEYEAWNVTGPDGFRVVSMPGGELAIWDR